MVMRFDEWSAHIFVIDVYAELGDSTQNAGAKGEGPVRHSDRTFFAARATSGVELLLKLSSVPLIGDPTSGEKS